MEAVEQKLVIIAGWTKPPCTSGGSGKQGKQRRSVIISVPKGQRENMEQIDNSEPTMLMLSACSQNNATVMSVKSKQISSLGNEKCYGSYVH